MHPRPRRQAVAEEEHPGPMEWGSPRDPTTFLSTSVQAAMEPTVWFNSFWAGHSAAALAADLSGKSEDVARSSPTAALFTHILYPAESHQHFFIASASRAAD